MVQANRALVRIFRACFLRDFSNPAVGRCTPYWWPLHPATELRHWGLRTGEGQILESLGPSPKPDKRPYQFQVLGSLGAQKGCIWCVTFRPSFSKDYLSYYSNHLGPYGKILRHVYYLSPEPEHWRSALELGKLTIHVTDPVKYRGDADNKKRVEGMQPWMWEKSVRCLRMEYQLLKPCCVLMTKLALSWFERGKPGEPGLHFESADRRAWRLDPRKQKLDAFLSKLQQVGVPESKWEDALARCSVPADDVSHV
jgi:hypothetical protein